jgi:UDP-GlcNAc:undecaprenyl-phosphate GlcNAc-1-phosphate transferase
MGDAGAMFLGLLMVTTMITIGGRTTDPFSGQTYFYFAPLLIPAVILGVPLVDTVFSFLRRVWRRQHFAQADREHLHHRLMRMGHGQRRAVVILWLWTALLSAAVLVPTFTNRGNSLVPLAVAALALLLYIYFHPGVRSARQGQARPDADAVVVAAAVVELEARRRARGSG